MLKFLTVSNNNGDSGKILLCNATLFVTKIENKQIILCANSTAYSQEINYRAKSPIGFLPTGAQASMYLSADANTDREKTWMYATNPISISGLINNGQVVAASKKEPLILYYTYADNLFSLFLYNLKAQITTPILARSTNSTTGIVGIENCQFQIGAFASTKQQDVFASCNLLNVTNQFFMQASQYQQSDRGLGDWCNVATISSSIIPGDFNGDKLTDLLCTRTGYAMINKFDSFVEIPLVKNRSGNWNTQFNAQGNLATGDFDGNGLSDFVSLNTKANPEILFNDGLSNFVSYTGRASDDGSFIINSASSWCGNVKAQLIAMDVDNDGKDDLLCKNNDPHSNSYGEVYLAISRTDPYRAPANSTISKIVVTLDSYNFGENIGYFISDKNAPLFCDASKVFEYFTQVSCALNSPNKVDQFTNPIRLSNAIPRLEVNTHIKGSIYLGDADRYGEINLNENQVYNEMLTSRFQFPKAKSWKLESKNFVDPSRNFDTKIVSQYIRQGKIKEQKQHLEEQVYSHKVQGGACNEINFSHITLVNKFTANGIIEVYDQNENKIMDQVLLRSLANLYLLSGNFSSALGTEISTQISNVAGGVVSFSFNGEMQLQTLYQKNVTQCSITGISAKDLTNSQAIAVPNVEDQSSICLLESNTPLQYTNTTTISGSTRFPSLLTRAEILEINGLISAGSAFFPDVIKNNTATLQIARYGTQISDISSKLNYNNSITLNAYVRGNGQYFAQSPHNELMVDFSQNGQIIYEPTRTKFPNGTLSAQPATLYAGFDNIKLVKLAAFDPSHILLAWTIYVAQEKQYYLLVDYVNTGGDLLRVPLYEQYFNITIANKRYGNAFYLSYKTSPDEIIITQYTAERFSPIASIKVGANNIHNNASAIESYGDTTFDLVVEESFNNGSAVSNLVLSRSHNNHQGKFIQKYDIFLNPNGTEANIICDTTSQKPDNLPTKIDDGYDVLRLDYQHNSKVIYHNSDRNYNLGVKVKLQNSLNFIHQGIQYLQTLRANSDPVTQVQVKQTLENIICKSSLSYEYLNAAMKRFNDLLASDLTYEIHTDTSNPNCKGSNSYPAYRKGTVVHICPGFDTITDNINECNRLVDLSGYTKGFIPKTSTQVPATELANLLPFFPSNIIDGYAQIFNSDFVSSGDQSAICHGGGAYGNPQQYVNNVANNLVAGLLSLDEAKFKVSISSDSNSCNNMVARGCAASYDKQANNLCLSYLLEVASTASLVAQAMQLNANVRYNCQTGCDLSNPALASLARSIGGYLTTNIDKNFVQTDSINAMRKVGIISANTSFVSSNDGVLTASPATFYEKNSTLITFAYLGNDYIDLKAQYFNFATLDPISVEQHLGRFTNVRQLQVQAYNQSAILVGYSVKHPSQSDYNILVQYITPTASKIVNIYPSYNGVFSLDTVPFNENQQQADISQGRVTSTEFMISYPEASNLLSTKRYKITQNSITEELKVGEPITDIQASNSGEFTVSVNAFLDKSFNTVWSYLNQAGIFIQKYNIFSGSKIGDTINLAANSGSYPYALRVDGDQYNKTIITWQNNNNVYLQMLPQADSNVPVYSTLSFIVCNVSVSGVSIVNSQQEIVAITLLDKNDKSKVVAIKASSDMLQNQTSLSYNSVTQRVEVSTSSPAALSPIQSTIIKGNCSDDNRFVIKNWGDLSDATITNKAIWLAESQDSVVEILKRSQSVNNISIEILYEVLDIAKAAMSDVTATLNANLEVLNSLNLSTIPHIDVSDQMSAVTNAFTDIQNLNVNKRQFKADSDSVIAQILDLMKSFIDNLGAGSGVETVAEAIKEVLAALPVTDEVRPIINDFIKMVDDLIPVITKFQSFSIPTSQEEIIEFIVGPVKETLISGIKIVLPPVLNAVEVVGDYIYGTVQDLFA